LLPIVEDAVKSTTMMVEPPWGRKMLSGEGTQVPAWIGELQIDTARSKVASTVPMLDSWKCALPA